MNLPGPGSGVAVRMFRSIFRARLRQGRAQHQGRAQPKQPSGVYRRAEGPAVPSHGNVAERMRRYHVAVRRYDAWRLRRDRREYYAYLAALLDGSAGSRTLKQIFADDARRHGAQTARGRMASDWVERFRAAGGDLCATWVGVFPQAELAVIRSAQAQGNDSMVATFAQLSRVLSVLERAAGILRASLLAAVLAMGVLAVTLVAVPWFTVPRLQHAFSAVPVMYHGRSAASLFAFAESIAGVWPVVLLMLGGLPWVVWWAMSRHVGASRRMLDRFGPWRIYRQIQALRFLAMLGVTLGRDAHGSTRLRIALTLQLSGSSPWLAAHVASMLARVDSGRSGAEVFDTGLLDPPQLWFLDDMIRARGLVRGLQYCSEWVERHVQGVVARQAAALRWSLLLTAVAGVLALALWHYAAIDDLRRALAMFYASH